ncbi:MAG: hypothetical protein WC326_15355 [Candidatus Delongbacteria bacterium]
MPVTEAEIQVGLVVYLDQQRLQGRRDVWATLGSRRIKVRPHVCVAVEGDLSAWTPLTSRWRSERLAISAGWRVGGDRAWRGGRSYLYDGACVVVGPRAAMAEASWQHAAPVDLHPAVSPEGCAQILFAVERARSRRQMGHALDLRADRILGLPVGGGPVWGPRLR